MTPRKHRAILKHCTENSRALLQWILEELQCNLGFVFTICKIVLRLGSSDNSHTTGGIQGNCYQPFVLFQHQTYEAGCRFPFQGRKYQQIPKNLRDLQSQGEKEMATHSSILAWRISGTEDPGGLPSVGSHRVGHD